ncbi:hypothetical protein SK128_025952 [Halocaridina rubra]|uniref:Uncharacterized protein n=1 Tax=Halocaridina rubra TaxID=373956 RepID=A0AAN8ZUD4_HALRR
MIDGCSLPRQISDFAAFTRKGVNKAWYHIQHSYIHRGFLSYLKLRKMEYSKANDPLDHRLWCNSSQAYFHLKEYQQAEEEAIVGMKLNPFFEKSYYWACKAAKKLGKHKEAANYSRIGKFLCINSSEIPQLMDEKSKMLENMDPKAGLTLVVAGCNTKLCRKLSLESRWASASSSD